MLARLEKVREKTSDTTRMAGAARGRVGAAAAQGDRPRAPPEKEGQETSELIGDHPWKGKIRTRTSGPSPRGRRIGRGFRRTCRSPAIRPGSPRWWTSRTWTRFRSRRRSWRSWSASRRSWRSWKSGGGARGEEVRRMRRGRRGMSRGKGRRPAPTPTAATDADDTLAETSEASRSADTRDEGDETGTAADIARRGAALGGTTSASPTDEPSSPRGCSARRPRSAAARSAANPVRRRRRVSTYANPETMPGWTSGRWSRRSRRVSAPSGPDQVDMTMGAHIDGFTRAWIDVAEPDAAAMRFDDDGSSPDGDGGGSGLWEPFVVRAPALLGGVSDESDRTLISNTLRAAATVRAEDEEVARGERVRSIRWTTIERRERRERRGEGGGREAAKEEEGRTPKQIDIADGGHHRQRPRAVPASMPRRGYSRGRVRRLPPPAQAGRRRRSKDQGGAEVSRRGRGRRDDGGVLARAADVAAGQAGGQVAARVRGGRGAGVGRAPAVRARGGGSRSARGGSFGRGGADGRAGTPVEGAWWGCGGGTGGASGGPARDPVIPSDKS